MGFTDRFLWGAASAAYQVEGAYLEDGKGLGVWDALSEGHVKHGDTGNVACDHYHRYKEDVALMKQLGLKAYRFSVSWPRIMPRPHEVNPKGLEFYSNLVDELLAAGIVPMCTIYHWNMPMWFYEKGGWFNPESSDDFAEFARAVIDALSDRVTHWMTFNEMPTFIGMGYFYGGHAPFERFPENTPEGLDRLCRLSKNVLLAHGKAASLLRSCAKKPATVGIAIDGTVYTPEGDDEAALDKARGAMFGGAHCRQVSWWMDPILKGTLHPELARYIGQEELAVIHGPLDFLGFNCYKSNNLDDDSGHNPAVYPGLPRTTMDWAITPDALYWAVRFLTERYGLPIIITENGMANTDFVMDDGCVHDPQRIQYLKWYLHGLKRAADEGYPVLGYMYWSIFDNFEWAEGYDKRFGIVYVDFQTQQRIPKDSALWYAQVIKENGENL